MIPYIKTQNGLTAIINGQPFSITDDNPSYRQVFDAIENNEPDDTIVDLFNTANAISRWSGYAIEVKDGALYYKGEPVHNVVADRIVEIITLGGNAESLIKFLENLLLNPSRRSIEELYTFLQHKALPITEDGCFLAYKGVQDNYRDVHSGKFDNRPGNVHEMPRSTVDDDFRRGCSYGFHVGSLEYATSWGTRTVIVKVNPKDVVSVPECSFFQKLRTAKYEVVCDYQGPLPTGVNKTDAPYDVDNRWNENEQGQPLDSDDYDDYDDYDAYLGYYY